MDSNYTPVFDAWIGSIFPRTSCLGKSKMGRRRSRWNAINGLAGFPFPRVSMDFIVETYHHYCESKIQNLECLTRL